MIKEKVKKLIEEFIETLPFAKEAVIFEDDTENNALWFHISSSDSRFLLGKDGEAISAINHLVRKIIEKNKGEEILEIDFFVDINGYQKKKIDNVKAIAHMMAERAKFFKTNIEMDPMSAYERRIVHSFLQSVADVTTESKGEGKDRRVVIKYME